MSEKPEMISAEKLAKAIETRFGELKKKDPKLDFLVLAEFMLLLDPDSEDDTAYDRDVEALKRDYPWIEDNAGIDARITYLIAFNHMLRGHTLAVSNAQARHHAKSRP